MNDSTLALTACRYDELAYESEIESLTARGLEIEEALRDEFIRPETANELLDELFYIDKRLEVLGE